MSASHTDAAVAPPTQCREHHAAADGSRSTQWAVEDSSNQRMQIALNMLPLPLGPAEGLQQCLGTMDRAAGPRRGVPAARGWTTASTACRGRHSPQHRRTACRGPLTTPEPSYLTHSVRPWPKSCRSIVSGAATTAGEPSSRQLDVAQLGWKLKGVGK